MSGRNQIGIGIFSCLLLALCSSMAQVPALMHYQGRLIDGTNLVNGSVGVSLRIYDDATGGVLLYEDSNTVAVVDGLYATLIGDDTTVGSLNAALAATNVWLEVAVDNVALTPRERIASVAFALVADQAATVTGPISDSQLPVNLARLDGTNQTFTGPVTFSSLSNQFVGRFSGDGSEVTGVDLKTVQSYGALQWTGDVSFVEASFPMADEYPSGIVAEDINGDGQIDFVVAHSNNIWNPSIVLAVVTNDGNGSFVLSDTLDIGAGVSSIVGADFTGNGYVDLVLAIPDNNTVTVMTNDGHGGFTIASTFNVGEEPDDLVACDVNGDGRMDIAMTDITYDVIAVMTNDGSGQLTLLPFVFVGAGPEDLEAVDVNGNGFVDLVTANETGSSLSVLTNNGAGDFTVSATLAVGGPTHSVVATDVNGDGQVDLVNDNPTIPGLNVWTNNGSGGFTLASSIAAQFDIRHLQAGDINLDGHMDLLYTSASTLYAMTNQGSGLFSAALTQSLIGSPGVLLRPRDINGDGRPDLAYASRFSTSAHILLNVLVTEIQFVGNGGGLTNLSASALVGTIQDGQIPVNFARLDTGIYPDARLSTNIARLSGPPQTFSGPVSLNNASGAFSGNGAGLTNLSASALTSGTLADARLSTNVARLDTIQSFSESISFSNATGSFTGNAGGLTNIQIEALMASRLPVIAWGYNDFGQTNVPELAEGVVAIAAGGNHNLVLHSNGTLIVWGLNNYGQTNVPATATGVVAVAGGLYHSLALRSDGKVVAWGYNDQNQTNVPKNATSVVAIAAGQYHSLALRSNGTVVAWGLNTNGQTNVPAVATGMVAVAAGKEHSMALRANGTILAWGGNPTDGQTNLPATATGVVAIAAGGWHSLALRADGTVIAWGRNNAGQTNVPAVATGVVAITAGDEFSAALRADGMVIVWGSNSFNMTNVPEHATGVRAIAGGGYHALALRTDRGATSVALLDRDNSFAGTVAAASFVGNGAGLTNLSVSSLVGTIPDARLSTNIPRLNATQTFSARQNVVTAPGVRALEVIGERTGTFGSAVVYLANTNTVLPSAPTLRLVGYGNATDGVFSVSAQSSAGNIARFGNGAAWVAQLDFAGNMTALTFTPSSDRNVKENFAPVDAAEILEKVAALPIQRWNYQADATTPHIGPMAQDFHAAFGVGPDNTRIATVDADGVALAAIQALAGQVKTLEADNERLRQELEAIKQKLGL